MNFSRAENRSTQEIARDFRELVEEGRALLGEFLDKRQEGASKLGAVLDDVTERVAGLQSSATQAAQQGVKHGARYARQADRYLHDNPWRIVAGAIILGVLATLWWNERR